MSINVTKESFGETPEGKPVDLYRLTNQSGIEVSICTYGGIITSLKTPDKQGELADIVLGFDTLDEYVSRTPYFGCLVGRYANRIAKGQFELEGKTYKLANNDGDNHLHGGNKGFDKVIWQAEMTEQGVKLSYVSDDAEEGYPGRLELEVSYELSPENELRIDYQAVSDKTTIVNLTNHSYFNLSQSEDILTHELLLNAKQFTPINEHFIPTGELTNVAASPFDFCDYKPIGQSIKDEHEQLDYGKGYDHNWVLEREAKRLRFAASAREVVTGRQLDVFTTKPGIQFYSGNMLPDLVGKAGRSYKKHSGFCLETQFFPDSPNQAGFPAATLKAGERYQHSTVFKFSTM